jgi:DNA-binding protein YbaB
LFDHVVLPIDTLFGQAKGDPADLRPLIDAATNAMSRWLDSARVSPASRERVLDGFRSWMQVVETLHRDLLADAGDSLDATAVLGQMMTMLEEVNAGMDTAMQMISARLSATHSAASAQGRVRATVDGSGAVTALVLDEAWLATEPAPGITRAINQAIAAAASAASAPENPLAGTPLERYAGVLDDPSALARILMGKD